MKEGQKKKKRNPAYFAGLGASTAQKRAAHFKKQTAMHWDDPEAYEPAPGDSRKTKTSKWTKKARKMFGESTEAIEIELLALEAVMFADAVMLESVPDDVLVESDDQLDEAKKKKGTNVTKALKNKAKSANAPMGALRAIYNKGLAAWRTGHRPGASQHAWAMARVNSVLAGGPARKVDAAQWKQIQKHRKK